MSIIFIDSDIPVFYLGLIYLEQGAYRRAADLFDSVSDSPVFLQENKQLGELARRYRNQAISSMTG